MATFLLLAGYLLLNVYIVTSIRFWLNAAGIDTKPKHWGLILLVIYVLIDLIPVGGAFLADSAIKWDMQEWGNLWLGIQSYVALLLLIAKLIWVIVTRKKDKSQFKKAAAVIIAICIAGSVGLNVYGWYHAQTPIVKNYDVQIDKTNDEVSSLKIVLLGDLHLSVNYHIETIRNMVEKVNAEDADVVLIAGDIFTSSYNGLRNPDEYSSALSEMKAKYGVYAVYGNHDVVETLFGGFPISAIEDAVRPQEMDDFMAASGITMLKDETISIAGVQIAGRIDGERAGDGTDHRMEPEELLEDCDASKPLVVLEHEPWDFANFADNGVDLALCGHTHNGQFFPGNLVVPFFNANGYGLKYSHGITSIVTAGVGYYGPPIRVGTDSEITVINVTFKE